MRNIRRRQMRARNRNPQKNQRSQNTPIRNEFEPSDQRFWAEGSDKGLSTQHLRPNIEPIYQYRESVWGDSFSPPAQSVELHLPRSLNRGLVYAKISFAKRRIASRFVPSTKRISNSCTPASS